MKRAPRKARAAVAPREEKFGARIREHRLENGLHVLLAERHLDPIVAVMLWYRVGARNESEREAGVSHFLEHMMFKGSAHFGKGMVDQVTTTLGGTNNAFTSADHTAYWFEFASDRWEQALAVEADRMKHLLLDPEEFAAEKKVVLEELAQGEDDPWRVLSQQVQTALFPRHPYRRPVIGYADTLAGLGVAEMRAYYERFYHPANAVLVIAGDFEPERALEHARAHFGAIPSGMPYALADTYRPPLEPPRGEQRLELRWDDDAKRLCLAWPTVAVGTDEDYALDLVSMLLTGGRLSRLYRRLVLEGRQASSVSTHNDTRIEGGCFWLFAECAQDAEPAVLEQALDRELEALATRAVSARELERAKRMLAASEAHEGESISDIAEELGEFAMDGDWRYALTTLDRIRGTSAEDVRRAAARLLTRERRVLGWCLPLAKRAAPKKAAAKRKPSPRRKPAARRKTVRRR